MKRQRRSQDGQAKDEHATEGTPGMTAREKSRESIRSRSKRRKKYRRRSDYAAAAAETVRDTPLVGLRDMKLPEDRARMTDPPTEGGTYDRTGSFESVLEEDEGMDEIAQEQ